MGAGINMHRLTHIPLKGNQGRMSSRHASLALINTFPPLLFFPPARSHPPISVCCMRCWFGFLHLAEQQVFARRNSDTWMHTVRQLIRDSASPLSPHLGRRGDAQRHTFAVALTPARVRTSKHECTAGGHLSAGQNQSRQSQSGSAHGTRNRAEKCKSRFAKV